MATADPNQAAQELAGQTYAGAQDRSTAQKQALLSTLATNGTYSNAIQSAAVRAAQPVATPVHPGDANNAALSASPATDAVQQFNHAASAAAAALAAHQAVQQQAAAGTYFDQVGKALPLEQSRATSDAAQIYQQLIDQREQRAAQQRLAEISLQEAQAQLANTRAAGARASSANGLSISQVNDAKGQAISEMLADPHLSGTNAKGAVVQNRTGRLAQWLATVPHATPTEISAQAKNLGIDDAHTQYAVEAANNYYQTLAGSGVYAGGATPTIQWSATPTPDTSNTFGTPGYLGPAQLLAPTSSVNKSKSKSKTSGRVPTSQGLV